VAVTDASPLPVLDAGIVGVRAGFTTRAGGVSTGPYAEADLARHVGDDDADVTANRRRLEAWAGAPVTFAHQVHGRSALVLDAAPAEPDPGGHDALVTAIPGLGVAVLVADCLPVLLADQDAGVVGAVHAGRPGLVAGVVASAVEAMAALGADPARTTAVLGPAVGGCCYELPAAMRADVEAAAPGSATTTTWGTPSVDLRAGATRQLERLGVRDVRSVGGCTVEDDRLFSYRRDGVTGRFAGVIVCPG